jgi:DNA polymerase I-like protein with 3'-5' exonuclease and polymerase domains
MLTKARSLGAFLKQQGIDLPLTKTGEPKVTAAVLGNSPIGKQIIQGKKMLKLRDTFCKSVRETMANGRVHPNFRQTVRESENASTDTEGAAYGRLSCAKPNIQQQPARDEWASFWRTIYLPEEGDKFCSADYSQQEPRWLTYFAATELPSLPIGTAATRWEIAQERAAHDLRGKAILAAREMLEAFCSNPNTDNHTEMTKLIHGSSITENERFKEYRDAAKQIFLGLCYGMQGARLAQQLRLPTKWIDTKSGRKIQVAGAQAQTILDRFNQGVPYVLEYYRHCQQVANDQGFITTAGGRRCNFPEVDEGIYDWTHKAMNRRIQGSAGDQIKKSMIAVDAAGHSIMIQVHDELCLSVKDREEALRIKEIMEATDLGASIPFKVDIEIGPSWGEAK